MTRRNRDRISQACCLLVLFGCVLIVLSDLAQLKDLWTLGGPVGPARWTVLLFVLLAIAILAQALRNGDSPFKELE
jgi:hypothetical protein